MQTRIIADDQLFGNANEKQDGRLYFFRRETVTRAAYTNIPRDGELSITIRFNSSMNITGISVQGKAIEPTGTSNIQFIKRYSVKVCCDNADKRDYSLGEVSIK